MYAINTHLLLYLFLFFFESTKTLFVRTFLQPLSSLSSYWEWSFLSPAFLLREKIMILCLDFDSFLFGWLVWFGLVLVTAVRI